MQLDEQLDCLQIDEELDYEFAAITDEQEEELLRGIDPEPYTPEPRTATNPSEAQETAVRAFRIPKKQPEPSPAEEVNTQPENHANTFLLRMLTGPADIPYRTPEAKRTVPNPAEEYLLRKLDTPAESPYTARGHERIRIAPETTGEARREAGHPTRVAKTSNNNKKVKSTLYKPQNVVEARPSVKGHPNEDWEIAAWDDTLPTPPTRVHERLGPRTELLSTTFSQPEVRKPARLGRRANPNLATINRRNRRKRSAQIKKALYLQKEGLWDLLQESREAESHTDKRTFAQHFHKHQVQQEREALSAIRDEFGFIPQNRGTQSQTVSRPQPSTFVPPRPTGPVPKISVKEYLARPKAAASGAPAPTPYQLHRLRIKRKEAEAIEAGRLAAQKDLERLKRISDTEPTNTVRQPTRPTRPIVHRKQPPTSTITRPE